MAFKNCCILLWIFVLYILGTWLFFSGFLLKRHVIHEYSSKPLHVAFNISCQDFSTLQSLDFSFADQLKENSAENTAVPINSKLKRFERAVIIIIDALRYDFADFINQSSSAGKLYLNNMAVFGELLSNKPRHSSLIKLIADAPTTTLQRLKAMTTGSLPTFIDLSLNFASAEILEDNLIYQIKHYKDIVFMGDDTWEGLFPDHFKRSFPYPSFNVKDLDTVDYGILDHIFGELKKNDWDVLIAHFLGVDHCGHRYGPKHPEMKRKLREMNDMLRKTIPLLKDDTVLFVIGDHGMTESGDHGGDSSDEISTVLFVYSPSLIFPETHVEGITKAAQIDFVPTVSLLLGLPIPFSNLGSVIPELFLLQSHNHTSPCLGEELDTLLGGTLALAENALQVQRFLYVYTNVSADLPGNIIEHSERMLNRLSLLWHNITEDVNKNKEVLKLLFVGYKDYLSYVKNECEQIWATFDLDKMSIGLLVLLFTVIINFMFASGFYMHIVVIGLVHLLIICSAVFILAHGYLKLLFCGLSVLVLVYCVRYLKRHLQASLSISSFACFTFFVVLLVLLCSFSNSFVVHEDSITLMLLQTTLIYRHFHVVQMFFNSLISAKNKTKKNRSSSQKIMSKEVSQFLLLFLALISVRLSFLFHKCREEQNCESSAFLVSLENLNDAAFDFYKKTRLAVSLSSIISPVLLVRFKLPVYSDSFAKLCITYGIPFICLCICWHWWIAMAPPHLVQKILRKNQAILAQSAVTVSALLFLMLWFFPPLSDDVKSLPASDGYYTSLGLLFITILLPSYLIAGDGVAPAVTLMSTLIILVPKLNSFPTKTATDISESEMWLDAVVWGLLSSSWFYGTGHQATFPAIQWQAAFALNYKEVVSYVLSGILVLFNTFCAQILHGIALPFLLICTQPMNSFDAPLTRLILKYLVFHGIKFLGASTACWVLRRHLMVWKIFSPKLVFEGVSLMVTMISITLSYFFILRTKSCYHCSLKSRSDKFWSSKQK